MWNRKTKLDFDRPPSTGFGPSSGSWHTPRVPGHALTTPLGTLCLAVFALGAGTLVTSLVRPSGEELARARTASAALADSLQEVRSTLAVREIQLQRMREIASYAERYDLQAGLARRLYDIALAEGLRPDLAFRMVETESSFRRFAVSEAGAVGYTQIKPSTARWLDPSVTRDDLFDTETNLRLGFRYFGWLLERYEGDERLALLAYNRGPSRVGALLAMGEDPANGYARRILTEPPVQ